MQGRKLSINYKNKQKLVLERHPNHESPMHAPNLTKNISVFKLLLNKQNDKSCLKQLQHRSLEKKESRYDIKLKPFQFRRTATIKTEFSNKTKENSEFQQEQHQNFYKRNMEDFIETLTSKLKKKNVNNQGNSILQLEQFTFHNLLRIMLEEGPQSSNFLNKIQSRINILLSLQSYHPNNEIGIDESTPEPKQKTLGLYSSYSQVFYPILPQVTNSKPELQTENDESKSQEDEECQTQAYAPNALDLQSNIINYHLRVKREKRQNEKTIMIFEHLSELNTYILNQPNKILHQAFRRHKYLEEELFAYADLLSISRLGACTYTPQINIHHTQKILDSQMKHLNREIIQGGFTIEQKCRMLRNYVFQVRKSYTPILEQLIHVIEKKTEESKTFVYKVLRWQENYITRKEFLSNLKKDYCEGMFKIAQSIKGLEVCLCQKEEARSRVIDLQENISKINQVFLLGNSFY